MSYGIVVSKDVMVTMRDGIRLATDLHRPGRDGELVEGRFPTIVCLTPYDKTERRYTEIADFFVPHGYAVVLQDIRDRHRSEGTKEYFHSATPHTGRGRLRHDRVDRRAAVVERPHRDGRQLVRGDHADPHRARAPAAPDRDLARRRADEHVPPPDARGRRDAAAHVLGALHPRRRRAGGAGRPGASRRTSGTTCATCGSCSGSGRGTRASSRSGTCRRSTRRSRTTSRAAPTTSGGRARRTTSRASGTSTRDIPGDDDDRLVRRLPALRHRVLRGDGRRRTRRRSG